MNLCSFSPVSFRDPAGFVYTHDGELRRQVNQVYREHYDRLQSSGCMTSRADWLSVRHEELAIERRA